MDGSSSIFDDNTETYHCSSSSELSRSNTDIGCSTPVCSTISDSRTSDVSAYSEFSSAYDSLPVRKPITKIVGPDSPAFAKLSRRKHTDVMNSKSVSELENVKEKFAKLLLGEDMSGGAKGVCAAVAISNAITNLYATVFGHLYKLEPLSTEKRNMWRREMDCLLSVCDYIVEFHPSSQTLPDGTIIDLMATRPRSDISINLPALEKLDAMLLVRRQSQIQMEYLERSRMIDQIMQEELDCFQETEFWYIEEDQQENASSRSFLKVVERNDNKWWLPVPCVPAIGLSEKAKKELQLKRECTNQIHKAAMAINSSILAEMEVPESYIAALPKSARGSVGGLIYRYMSTADQFSPHYLLDQIDISSEHDALEIADHLEASMYIWRRKTSLHASKSSWDMVKDLIGEENKNEMLANRAESLLFCLKQRYRGLRQTTLDTSKIHYNKDVGQAILESYSRVLESLAFRIVAWIDDVLFVDASVKKRLEEIQKT